MNITATGKNEKSTIIKVSKKGVEKERDVRIGAEQKIRDATVPPMD